MAADSALAALGGGLSSKEALSKVEPAAKRTCLRHYDLVPAQVLNPMGMSGIESIPLENLWTLCKKGNKGAAAFSNLCFDENDRQNVGLSQACEALMAAITRFEGCPQTALVINESILTKAKAEAKELKPHLAMLNQGRNKKATGSIKNVAYYVPDAVAVDKQSLIAASAALHDWLSKEGSVLRGLLAYLSGGGVFFVAQCHEKTMRAYVAHGGGTKQAMAAAATCRPTQAADSSAMTVLGN